MTLAEFLPLYWYCIIGLAVLVYVILDGYSQGIGILLPFAYDQHERHLMLSVVLPNWDGNQTWLVFGTAALYGAFPLAFATLLPMLYLPIMSMVIAILFRGVAFEYRMKSTKHTHLWDRVIFISSFMIAFMQGNILGAFVEGFNDLELTKNALSWHSTFAYLTGLGVVSGYALLGATRLILKLEGRIQTHMYELALKLLIFVTVFMGIVSLITPFVDPQLLDLWFNPKSMIYLIWLPVTTMLLILKCIQSLKDKQNDRLPYFLSFSIFVCGFLGLAISTFPYLVPRSITLWDAAAPTHSLIFVSIGATIILPVLIAYTSYSYYVFKGKVKEVIKY